MKRTVNKDVTLELRKVDYSHALSQETPAYTAELYVNGKRAAYLRNTGHGAGTMITSRDTAGRRLIKQAEDAVATLPEEKSTIDGKPFSWKRTLYDLVDSILYDHLAYKDIQSARRQRKVVFYDTKRKGVFEWKLPKRTALDKLDDWAKSKHNDNTIVLLLVDEERAVNLYMERISA